MFHSVLINTIEYPSINSIQFGHEKCESLHSYGPAMRFHWLLHFVVSGFGSFEIRGKKYKLSAGDIFVIPPNVETFYQADAENPWSYIWIGFTCNGKIPIELPDTIYCPEALHIFNKMKNCENFQSAQK